jgi:hypothetical protein
MIKFTHLISGYQYLQQQISQYFQQIDEPRTTQKRDRDGNVYYQVYDPRTQDSAIFGSESEIRWWIEQHYSR